MVSRLRRAIAVLLIVLALGLTSCGGDRNAPAVLLEGDEAGLTTNPLVGAIAEVSPPERIQQLKPFLDVYEPQVRIVSPQDNDTLQDTTVSVKLQARDFPIYKDADLGFGPHLHLFLDDQPYQAVYDVTAPITFTDLAPGTHTLRVLATRPWGESFKNEGAYDQVTFSVFTASPQNDPDDSQLLLTYGQPQDSYGAEPIMLDFYLKNAPLHIVAESEDAISDWRLRCTVNGESFVFDRWQPIYLKGFRPGKNWVKLEVVDENGSLINNAFNTGIRVIDYTPGGEDGLSRLVRGEIPLSQAKVLVDPNYVPPAPVEETLPAAEPPEETILEEEKEISIEETPASASEILPSTDDVEVTAEETEETPTEELSEPEPADEESEESEEPIPDTVAPDSDESDTIIEDTEDQFDNSTVPQPEAEEFVPDELESLEDSLEAPPELDTAQESNLREDAAIEGKSKTDEPEPPSPETTTDSLGQSSALPTISTPAASTSEDPDAFTENNQAVEDNDFQTPEDLEIPAPELELDADPSGENTPNPTTSEAEFDFI